MLQNGKGAFVMAAKHRITVNLDDAEYEALQRIAAGTDRSLAWLGRRAICDFIEQRERADAPLLAGLMAEETSARQSAT
jgi:predicted transcriptional regulator